MKEWILLLSDPRITLNIIIYFRRPSVIIIIFIIIYWI